MHSIISEPQRHRDERIKNEVARPPDFIGGHVKKKFEFIECGLYLIKSVILL